MRKWIEPLFTAFGVPAGESANFYLDVLLGAIEAAALLVIAGSILFQTRG